jgi:hypothetical protein
MFLVTQSPKLFQQAFSHNVVMKVLFQRPLHVHILVTMFFITFPRYHVVAVKFSFISGPNTRKLKHFFFALFSGHLLSKNKNKIFITLFPQLPPLYLPNMSRLSLAT